MVVNDHHPEFLHDLACPPRSERPVPLVRASSRMAGPFQSPGDQPSAPAGGWAASLLRRRGPPRSYNRTRLPNASDGVSLPGRLRNRSHLRTRRRLGEERHRRGRLPAHPSRAGGRLDGAEDPLPPSRRPGHPWLDSRHPAAPEGGRGPAPATGAVSQAGPVESSARTWAGDGESRSSRWETASCRITPEIPSSKPNNYDARPRESGAQDDPKWAIRRPLSGQQEIRRAACVLVDFSSETHWLW